MLCRNDRWDWKEAPGRNVMAAWQHKMQSCLPRQVRRVFKTESYWQEAKEFRCGERKCGDSWSSLLNDPSRNVLTSENCMFGGSASPLKRGLSALVVKDPNSACCYHKRQVHQTHRHTTSQYFPSSTPCQQLLLREPRLPQPLVPFL